MLGLSNANPTVTSADIEVQNRERNGDQDQTQHGDDNALLSASPQLKTQLSLFQNCYGPASAHERQSHVIEIWDAAPKYCTPRRCADLKGKTPYVLERTFDFRGTRFRMRVAPVVFKTSSGEDVVRLPTAREELIEDVLRQMAIQQHRGFVGNQKGEPIFGVRFSLDLLRRELARQGHGIKYGDLVDSLMILSGCVVEIGYAHQRTVLQRASILPQLVGVSRSDYLNDRTALWTAHFHPMVVSSLAAIAYRQYDYQTTLGYRSALARWLHKHLSLVYLNAAMTQSYTIGLATIRDGSGLLNRPEVRHQARDVESALEALKTSEYPVLRSFERHPVYQDRQLVDVHYQLFPTADFVKQTVAANRRQKDGKLALNTSAVSTPARMTSDPRSVTPRQSSIMA